MSHARLVQEWLEGWNGHDIERIMAHYAKDATFQSPSVHALEPGSEGILRGRNAIRGFYARTLNRFPALRFELEDVIERPYGVIVICRKLNVFSERPELTVEVFETRDGLVKRNVVYWQLSRLGLQPGQNLFRSPVSEGSLRFTIEAAATGREPARRCWRREAR